jgi:cytochrome c oxidase subunit 1
VINFFYSIFSGRKLTTKNPWGAKYAGMDHADSLPVTATGLAIFPTVQRWAYDYGKDGEEFIPQYIPLKKASMITACPFFQTLDP